MQRSTQVRIAAGLTVLAISVSASAQFFAGLPVIDAANLEQALEQKIKTIAILAEAIKTYEQVTNQYNHLKYEAKRLKGLKRSPDTLWKGVVLDPQSGILGPWSMAANTGQSAGGAWEAATLAVEKWHNLGEIPKTLHRKMMTDLASISLADGAGVSTLDSIGRVRAQGPAIEKMINEIEADQISGNDDLQTQTALQQRRNAIALLQVKAAERQNQLLTATAEMQLTKLRQDREAAARALAADIAFRQQGLQVMNQWGQFSDAQRNFRFR
jgi:hypothetical protein